MGLERPDSPENWRNEAIDGLSRLTKTRDPEYAAGGAPPTVSSSLQVFTIDPRDAATGAGLEKAKPVGWDYLSGQSGTSGGSPALPTVIAGVAEQNGIPRFTNRRVGWLPRQTQQTINIAASLPEVNSGSYELRLLRLPAISQIDALWLKNNGAGSDLVIPIASKSSEVVSGQKYTASEFLDLVRHLASQPHFDNSPRHSQRSGQQ
jgi:hypothetical protein